MSLGLVGRKVGMMRIFRDDGTSVPVTVIDCSGNRVAQVKSADKDGYTAVQVAFGSRRAGRVTKAQAGHFAKAGVEAASDLREFRVEADKLGDLKAGSELKVDMFAQDPGRVFPGKRMSGHLGDVKRTVQLLEVARVDAERSLLLIKGSVPGPKNAPVIVRPSVKARPKAAPAKGGK
jgi:large subunit ribosomal protein L3